MIKSHQIKLNPTKAQEILLKKSCGVKRKSFNWGLDMWNTMFKNGEKPSAINLANYSPTPNLGESNASGDFSSISEKKCRKSTKEEFEIKLNN
jgi:transposase